MDNASVKKHVRKNAVPFLVEREWVELGAKAQDRHSPVAIVKRSGLKKNKCERTCIQNHKRERRSNVLQRLQRVVRLGRDKQK